MKPVVLSCALAMLAWSTCWAGADSKKTVKRVLSIGVEKLEYRPYGAVENEQYVGFGRELLDLFAKTNHLQFKYELRPIKGLVTQFLKGDFDLKFPDNEVWHKDQRKGYPILYSDPVVKFIDGTLVLPKNISKLTTHKLRLATISGFTPPIYIDLLKTEAITLLEVDDLPAMIRHGLSGAVDGVYANVQVVNWILKRDNQKNRLVFDPGLPFVTDYYRLSTIKHPELMIAFNTFLKTQSGPISQLKRKFKLE